MSKANSRFAKSHSMLERALKTIPIASQTFSKSHIQFPKDNAPLFIENAKGARFTDVDGNEFVDLVMALAPVSLGHQDQDVDDAIRAQLEKGISLSMPGALEHEVAELLVEIIPSAQLVRFGKNGSDATSAAVRLARAFTGRSHIITLGYHGWHDWYIGTTTRHLGVPDEVRALSHALAFNDLDALKNAFAEFPGQIAAVVLEPAGPAQPAPGYLQGVIDLAHENGALVVFDEIVTGFKYALGGAQEYFGVTPDLTALGKGIANGMPLSAIVGRADVMKMMEDIFFSGTFGGEALSLAAAKATIEKMKREDVIGHLWKMGAALHDEVKRLLAEYGLTDAFTIMGNDPMRFLIAKDYKGVPAAAIRTFYLKNMIENNVMTNGAFTMSYAFGKAEFDIVVRALDKTFAALSSALVSDDFMRRLDCEVIVPVFQVRKN